MSYLARKPYFRELRIQITLLALHHRPLIFATPLHMFKVAEFAMMKLRQLWLWDETPQTRRP
jgi:hypothetical protein